MGEKNPRVEWIDCAKGIGIILVIIGHTWTDGVFKSLIFSIHMPLFFILSGMTFSFSENFKAFFRKMIKSFMTLIVPIIIAYLLPRYSLYIHKNAIEPLIDLIVTDVLTVLFSNVSTFYIGERIVNGVSMLWFLMVLFSARLIFDLLHLIIKNKAIVAGVCIALSILGNFWSKETIFSIDIAMVVLPYLAIGYYSKSYAKKEHSVPTLVGMMIPWLLGFIYTYYRLGAFLSIGFRRYLLFPIGLIVAIFGSFVLYEFSKRIMRNEISKYLCMLGKNSLYLLIIHYIDYMWFDIYSYYAGPIAKCLMRITIDIAVFWVVLKCISRRKESL